MPNRLRTPTKIGLVDPGPTVSIFWIGRAMCPNYGTGRLLSYVGLLVRDGGFPAPLPALKTGRRKPGSQIVGPAHMLTSEVTLRSFWRRDAVETWLSTFLPPDLGAAIDRRAAATAAQDMDAAAAQLARPDLRLVAGGRS